MGLVLCWRLILGLLLPILGIGAHLGLFLETVSLALNMIQIEMVT